MSMINKALDEYNEGNPIARAVKKKLPEGYIYRPILWAFFIGVFLFASDYISNTPAYIECKPSNPMVIDCIHPFTNQSIPIGYTEGKPVNLQFLELLSRIFLFFLVAIAINHAYYDYRRP
jgi:hypothetical protein